MIPNDSIDFYPTPDDLADDMIRALRASNDGSGLTYLPEPILEPSAGNGAIARAVERAAGIRRGEYVFPSAALSSPFSQRIYNKFVHRDYRAFPRFGVFGAEHYRTDVEVHIFPFKREERRLAYACVEGDDDKRLEVVGERAVR